MILGTKPLQGLLAAEAQNLLGADFLKETKDTIICGLRFSNVTANDVFTCFETFWDFQSPLNFSEPASLMPLEVFTQNLFYERDQGTFGVRIGKALGIPLTEMAELVADTPYILQWAFGNINNSTSVAPDMNNMGLADFSYVIFDRLKQLHADNNLAAVGF